MPDFSNNRWNRGYVEVDGLRISIRDVVTGSASDITVNLAEFPPPEWSSADCQITEGCRKDQSNCEYHGRQRSFSGIGVKAIRNPTWESER
jgi:hypothetical protein